MPPLTAIVVIVAAAVVLVILAFQLIANWMVKELYADGGQTLRDAIDRLEKATVAIAAAVGRLEKAGKVVASELLRAQERAGKVINGEAGAAADAAAQSPKNA